MDGDEVSGNNFEQVAIDGKYEARLRRGIDQSDEVSFAFFEDFAKDWLAILYRNTPSWRTW